MKNKSSIKMYFKIFFVIFLVGMVFPYAVNFLIGKMISYRGDVPSGNSVFVMYSMDNKVSILEYIGRIFN